MKTTISINFVNVRKESTWRIWMNFIYIEWVESWGEWILYRKQNSNKKKVRTNVKRNIKSFILHNNLKVYTINTQR